MSDGERADENGIPEEPDRELAEELRALGRGMRVPDVDGETMAERVLAQLLADTASVPTPAAAPTPVAAPAAVSRPAARVVRVRRLLRRRWRALAAGLSGLLVVLVLTPPVRAAVADWFDFGGVRVRYDPTAPPGGQARVPDCADPVSIEEAGRRAGFAPRIPAELGAPDRVSVDVVAAGRPVVSLCWADAGGRTIRLDEFRAGLDMAFSKQVRHMPEWLVLNSAEPDETTGLWFADPHVLRFRMIDGQGERWTHSARMAAPTLLWEYGGGPGGSGSGSGSEGERLTLRLEGVASLERAQAVAQSLP